MSVWHCPDCGTTMTWIYNTQPGCPYRHGDDFRDHVMQQVTDDPR